MNTPDTQLRVRNLRTLAVLAALFLLPVAASFWMYYGSGWRPAGHSNHGELIAPARPVPAAEAHSALFHGKWSLVYVGDGDCGDECHHALYVMRQTRLSLNNEMRRVERVFVATGHCCAREFLAQEHPGLQILDTVSTPDARLVQTFPDAAREHQLFIVDPLGNLMMSYDTRENPKGLLEDLKKLLTLSHIG
jgi:hypothetical protein